MAYQPGWVYNAKAILTEGQLWYYLANSWEDNRVHTFLKGISPKVNAITRLEFEPVNLDVAVQYQSHYTTGTSPVVVVVEIVK